MPDSPNALAASIVVDRARYAGDVATASILPGAAYASESFWQFEVEHVFSREWLCVGHVSQVPQIGDVLARTLAGEPLLMTRDDAGIVRVMSAVCRHRGHPLLDGLDRPPSGACVHAARLTCPYHAWVYALDGRLLSAPFMNETTSLTDLKASTRLPEIRSEHFHGFVFVNFDPDAAPLGPTLAELDAELRAFGLEHLQAEQPPIVQTDLPFNWKGYFENALEPYHTDFVHRSSHDAAPASASGFFPFHPGDGQILTFTGFREGSNELLATDGQAMLPGFDGLSDVQEQRLLFAAIPPTWFAVISPTSVLAQYVRGTSAATTDLESCLFYPPAARAAEGFAEAYEHEIAQLDEIQQEDFATQSAVQRAYSSRYAPTGPLSWLEATLPQFNAWLIERYEHGVEVPS